MLTILCIADTPPKLPILEWVKNESIDLIITLGDLEYTQINQLEAVITIPKIGIYGNHCTPGYMEPLGIMNLHMHTWSYGGLTFGGFEGSPRYKRDPYTKMYSEEEATEMLKKFPPVDVFISHSPPRGINDEDDVAHTGFLALRTYLDEKQPRYFLHGHTYPKSENLVKRHGNTEILYINGDQLIALS